MYVWFSDIDNTLLYSHRVSMQQERIVIEYLNGKEQGYMSKVTYDFLRQKDRLPLVPITTRTPEQYTRLPAFSKLFGCQHAIVANGAILLNYGQIDELWLEETKVLAQKEIDGLQEVMDIKHQIEIKNVMDLMLYYKAEDPKKEQLALKKQVDLNKIDVLYDHRKVYCIPRSVTKGNAVRRYKYRFQVSHAVISGDSEFDISMLNEADLALAPMELLGDLKDSVPKISLGNDRVISDALCRKIRTFQGEEG